MIIFDLRCEKNHSFEGWFNDRAAFEDQRSRKLLSCPVCGSSKVEMVPSSISIMAIDSRRGEGTCITLVAPCARVQERRRATDKLI